jgi:hypothetical protein
MTRCLEHLEAKEQARRRLSAAAAGESIAELEEMLRHWTQGL